LIFVGIIGVEKAHAGVLSFLAGVLGDKEANAGSGDSRYNSQNIALLEAPHSEKLAIGGGDISIVNNEALEYAEGIDETQNDQISVYIVRDGDTLSQIAKMFSVSVNTIIWANDIARGSITPGQELIILPVSGIRHAVVKGETLQSIVKKHGGDLEEVLQFNNLSENVVLAVGDEIIIPDGEATAPTKAATSIASKPSTAGFYVRPISGGRRTQGIHGHNGIDIAASVGTPIYASAAGKVIVSRSSGYNGGYGNYVVISHSNGTQTLYAHLNSTAVAQGVSVVQGQVIGYLGNTGRSTGPHLHFEVRGAKNPF
jgi:murein DD-endopeptidase MepM/ murein hydrolase activator NlpD